MMPNLIAPCGMNCSLCRGFQRDKKKCPGCRGDESTQPSYCGKCIIKHCDLLSMCPSGWCYECAKFPCRRLKQLDKRYRTKYNLSMIDNLEKIRDFGIDAFMKKEMEKWSCADCGRLICVHLGYCLQCKSRLSK